MLGLLLVSGTGLAAADGVKPATRISQDLADLLSPRAAALSVETDEGVIESPVTPIPDVVTIDAVASGDPAALEAELIALGAQDTAIAGRMVSARIPLAAIPYLEGVVSLQFARAAQAVTNVGIVTSQGDKVMRADIARGLYGVDGTGVLVGVLSDSFNCQGGAATDMANGDLPPTVTVVQESPCGPARARTRAGRCCRSSTTSRPGASLAFATAFNGQASFAEQHPGTARCGAKVIVDDVSYVDEPMFQDGVIAAGGGQRGGLRRGVLLGGRQRGAHGVRARVRPGADLRRRAPSAAPFLGGTAHNFGGTPCSAFRSRRHGLHDRAAVGLAVLLGQRDRAPRTIWTSTSCGTERQIVVAATTEQPRVRGPGRDLRTPVCRPRPRALAPS